MTNEMTPDEVREALAEVLVAHLCDPFPAREVTEDDREVADSILSAFDVRPRGTVPAPQISDAEPYAVALRAIANGDGPEFVREFARDALAREAQR